MPSLSLSRQRPHARSARETHTSVHTNPCMIASEREHTDSANTAGARHEASWPSRRTPLAAVRGGRWPTDCLSAYVRTPIPTSFRGQAETRQTRRPPICARWIPCRRRQLSGRALRLLGSRGGRRRRRPRRRSAGQIERQSGCTVITVITGGRAAILYKVAAVPEIGPGLARSECGRARSARVKL
jgi:hypothetical protein